MRATELLHRHAVCGVRCAVVAAAAGGLCVGVMIQAALTPLAIVAAVVAGLAYAMAR